MIDFIIKYWLQVCFGVLTAIVGAGFRWIGKKFREEQEEKEALKNGVLALLHDRLYTGTMQYVADNEISTSELKNMEQVYNGYHGMGGNGTGTELWERVKKLPLKVED